MIIIISYSGIDLEDDLSGLRDSSHVSVQADSITTDASQSYWTGSSFSVSARHLRKITDSIYVNESGIV